MAKLKNQSITKCLSILKGYIDGSTPADREAAILALEHLQNISAGTDQVNMFCFDLPKADIPKSTITKCVDTVRINGAPKAEIGFVSCDPRHQIPDLP